MQATIEGVKPHCSMAWHDNRLLPPHPAGGSRARGGSVRWVHSARHMESMCQITLDPTTNGWLCCPAAMPTDTCGNCPQQADSAWSQGLGWVCSQSGDASSNSIPGSSRMPTCQTKKLTALMSRLGMTR